MSCTNKKKILEIEELSVSFLQYKGKTSRQSWLPVISGLSVAVREGELVAVVGSSGSGKSLLAHAVMGLLLPKETETKYPFECSGGMTRRILLSTALMENPKLIIADEPTPGMDLTLAKKSMEDFRKFADEGNGVLLITHDIELALEVADRIVVFYAGKTVEEAPVSDFCSEETLRHPYTKALWRALPQNGFTPLDGTQPYVKDMPQGCPFGPRCSWYREECKGEIPMVEDGCGSVRCIRYCM